MSWDALCSLAGLAVAGNGSVLCYVVLPYRGQRCTRTDPRI